MKRILSLFIVVVMCLCTFTACQLDFQGIINGILGNKPEPDLDLARSTLLAKYTDLILDNETLGNFNLDTVIMANSVTYTVDWVSDNESIVVVPNDDDTVTIQVPVSRVELEYTLTATITAPDGTSTSEFFELVVPKSNTYTIKEALTLEDGTKLTVSGTVIDIGTAYDPGYNNISVTIEDANGDRLYLYRLKGEVTLGDMITVTGEMATHGGARQIAAGATAKINGKDPNFVAPELKEYSIPDALKLKDLMPVIVKGQVVKVDTPWDSGYKNMSVTIADEDGNQLYVYRLATQVELGDFITVTGKMTTHYEDRQIAQGATAEITGHEDIGGGEDNPPEGDDENPTDAKEILDALYGLADGDTLNGSFTLTGKITALDSYNNPTFVVEGFEDRPVYCYMLKDDRFVVGATITVTSTCLKNYKGTYEFTYCTLDNIILPSEGGEGGETPDQPENPNPDVPSTSTSLKTGDKVVIYAPAYNMALSATKTGHYNVGVDISGGFAGVSDAEVWVVAVNADGTYTFTSLTGKVLAMADSYDSLNDEGANSSWVLEAKDGADGIYYIKNSVRGNYVEWYAKYNNWSTYTPSSLDGQFELCFHLVTDSEGGNEGGEVTPPEGGEGGEGGEDTPDVPTTSGKIELTVDSLGIPSQSYTANTATVNGVGFEWIQIGNYGNGIQVRDKDGKTSSLWNTTAFSAPIARIELVANSGKSTYDNPDCAIYSFGNAVGEYTSTVKLSTVKGTYTYTITPDAETYTFFRFEHDLGYTQYWDSITIVLVDGTVITQ